MCSSRVSRSMMPDRVGLGVRDPDLVAGRMNGHPPRTAADVDRADDLHAVELDDADRARSLVGDVGESTRVVDEYVLGITRFEFDVADHSGFDEVDEEQRALDGARHEHPGLVADERHAGGPVIRALLLPAIENAAGTRAFGCGLERDRSNELRGVQVDDADRRPGDLRAAVRYDRCQSIGRDRDVGRAEPDTEERFAHAARRVLHDERVLAGAHHEDRIAPFFARGLLRGEPSRACRRMRPSARTCHDEQACERGSGPEKNRDELHPLGPFDAP